MFDDDQLTLDAKNASVLASLIADPTVSEHVRLQVLNKLLEAAKDKDFFDTMFEESMSVGECPDCGHINHWLVPEDELNQRGYVTSQKDQNVKPHTTSEDCSEYAEACAKKKTSA